MLRKSIHMLYLVVLLLSIMTMQLSQIEIFRLKGNQSSAVTLKSSGTPVYFDFNLYLGEIPASSEGESEPESPENEFEEPVLLAENWSLKIQFQYEKYNQEKNHFLPSPVISLTCPPPELI